jgi:phenylalanyl-tRNA synthetase beta chain
MPSRSVERPPVRGRPPLPGRRRPTVACCSRHKSPRLAIRQGAPFDAFSQGGSAAARCRRSAVGNLQPAWGGRHLDPGRSATLGLGRNLLAAFGGFIEDRQRSVSGRRGGYRPPSGSAQQDAPASLRPASSPGRDRCRLLVPAEIAANALVRAIRGAEAVITDARLFDYEGEQASAWRGGNPSSPARRAAPMRDRHARRRSLRRRAGASLRANWVARGRA